MEWLTDPELWIGLLTLTALEIVLGIDNIVFISILSGKLAAASQNRARQWGLTLAMGMRVLLLLTVVDHGIDTPTVFRLRLRRDRPRAHFIFRRAFSPREGTREIHKRLENIDQRARPVAPPSFGAVLVQIVLVDIVFSLDSVITAVGMVNQIPVMIAAVIISVALMLVFAASISNFIDRHPTLKMLALSFLLLIGVNLIGEALGFHIPKGYTYFAMGFSVMVEMFNLRIRKSKPARATRDP